MNKIQNLISSNKIEEALEELKPSVSTNMWINLKGRWNSLQHDKISGVLSPDQERIRANKIVQSILSLAGGDLSSSPTTIQSTYSTGIESDLLSIMAKYKRRDKDLHKEASGLLKEYRAYQDQKNINPSYDPSKRRLKIIKNKVEALNTKAQDTKLDDLESIVQKVNKLISAEVPSYKELEKAYHLCNGRGFSDSRIESILSNKPNDDESKITIAERIELFLSRI